MKIAICESMSFAREMIDIKNKLEEKGHEVIVPKELEEHVNGKTLEQDKWKKLNFNVFKNYFREIKEQDAILVINKVEGYIGGNSLIEMAFAHVLDKKIFLLNKVPEMNYTNEIEAMNPILIDEDLSKIKEEISR